MTSGTPLPPSLPASSLSRASCRVSQKQKWMISKATAQGLYEVIVTRCHGRFIVCGWGDQRNVKREGKRGKGGKLI